MSSAVKRIINKDIKEIHKNSLDKQGIFIEFNEDNLLEAKAMIVGPEDSVYEGGVLFFKIFFPKNYPYAPPDVCYIARNRVRIHPNLYTRHHPTGHGKVCLSILGTWSGPKWTSVMDTSTVLLTIQSLLDKKPLFDRVKVYHYTNSGHTTWYGLAKAIQSQVDTKCKIHAVNTAEYLTKAPRPKYSVLSCEKLKKEFNLKPSSWELALRDCLEKIG